MPPVRERRGAIPLLIDAFLLELKRSTGTSAAGLTPDSPEMLVGYEWPGNVRELHNALERAAILCQDGPITGEHLSLPSTSFVPRRLPPNLPDVERHTIKQVLQQSDWNKVKAARRLGITRTQLYCPLPKYGVERT
jgi:DNA-binding NtrC family response regulator